MDKYSSAISRLHQIFGNNIDKDALTAILEMCNGNVDEARKFLEATDPGTGYDARTLSTVEGSIPSDYPGQSKSRSAWDSSPSIETTTKKTESSIQTPEEKTKALFIKENITLSEHLDAQKSQYETYASVLLLLLSQGVEISKASRSRILAACWSRKDFELPDFLMLNEELFGLPQILGGLNLLDAPRKVRAIEKKIVRLEKQGTAKPKTIGQLKSTVNDLKKEIHIGSVSGALAKKIRAWIRSIPSEKLEFYALNLPKQPWQELTDLVHAKPTDFKCSWFLEFIYGKEAPSDSVIMASKLLKAETLSQVLEKSPIPYSYLRLNVKPIPENAKVIIAKYSPIDTVIWYYEELASKEVDEVISARLDKEAPKFGYGKLMERLLYFRSINAKFYKKMIPIAENRLQQVDLQLESPLVVFGDASYSMDVAIRVSTVISSLLTSLTGAELKFFNTESFDPPKVPRNIEDVLDVAFSVKSHGGTAPTAALYEYYTKKKVVKFFVVVTDEVENDKYKNMYFPTLFQKYYHEVFPAKIVFVSFLDNPSSKGRMVTALEQMGIEVILFRLDGKRPDLTKLDSMLGQLASESTFFSKQVKETVGTFKEGGVSGVNKKLYAPKERDFKGKDEEKSTSNSNSNMEVKSEKKPETKPESKRVEKTQEEKEKLCVICEERPSQCALLECGHLNFCLECAKDLKDCPICRQPVVRYVRIFQN